MNEMGPDSITLCCFLGCQWIVTAAGG